MVATNIVDGDSQLRLAQVRLLALDVDGVLTDGGVIFGSDGSEQKRFHVSDGLGLVALQSLGIVIVWLSGRRSTIVERRAGELSIPHVLQGVRDKAYALRHLMEELDFEAVSTAYVGDDWNDLLAFEVVGVRIAVSNAAVEVLKAAHFVTSLPGGQGAVREVCEALMDARGQRSACLEAYLNQLRSADMSEASPH